MNRATPTNDGHIALSFILCCEEPFRVFFPLGTLLGIIGVSLWPLYYLTGGGLFYPNVAHARLMIEGFMASSIFGFLGTAGPRITSAPPFSLGELITIFTLDLLAAGLHIGEAHRFGDVVFVACLIFFVAAMGFRFHRRKDSPPPNFVLVALGLVCGVVGTVLVACAENAQYSGVYQFGSALLNQCFVLLPMLGIAPFFIGRLLDQPARDVPESRSVSPRWRRQAMFALFIGLIIVGSFALELAISYRAIAPWVRVLAIAWYIMARLPFHGSAFLASWLRIGIGCTVAGLAGVALWPIYRVGAWHIVFIGGFNVVLYTVATRVVFGHSGNLERVRVRMPFFIAMIVLLLLAMISRFTADLAPAARTVHLVGAAICWLTATVIWGLSVIPKTRLVETED